MTIVLQEVETKGGIWMSPEDYVTLLESDPKRRASLMRRVKTMLFPNGRTPDTFDPRHVKRISNRLVYLYVSKPSLTSEASPRID